MPNLQDYTFLQIEILNNTISGWITALAISIGVFILLIFLKKVILKNLKIISKKTKTKLDDIAIKALEDVHWSFFLIISLYIAITFLNTNDIIEKIIYYILLISFTYYTIKGLQDFVEYATEIIIKKKMKGDDNNIAIVQLISKIIKISLWVGAVLLILSNLGYNINSLVAGLGIGGIAVALALQNILGDIFSSFSIFFDKPFRVGDFITIGSHKGTVKKIGLKTTRIYGLEGEELIISNNELTKAKLQNYGVMEQRRISFSINIDQETTADKLKKIPDYLTKIIEAEKNTEVDRIHFSQINENHFVFSIVYYVGSKEYKDYLDIQQNVNLEIVEKFAKEGIKFSHPTQTVYVKKDDE